MSTYLAYFERELLAQITTGILGSEISIALTEATNVWLNFKIILGSTSSSQHSSTVNVDKLLPEQIADAVKDACPLTANSLEEIRSKLLPGQEEHLKPGTPIMLKKVKIYKNRVPGQQYIRVADEECASVIMESGQFNLCGIVSRTKIEDLEPILGEPVEVLGVLRLAPMLKTKASASDSLGLRIAAIWLR